MVDQTLITQAARVLMRSKQLVVLTGAGISKESGVPTFRDAQDGLWAKYDPMSLATPQAFQSNPGLVWDWYRYRRQLLAKAAPNPGHYALAALEDLLPRVVVITQNIDGFHQQVGSTDVISLHGDLRRNKCFNNCQGNPTIVDLDMLDEQAEEDGPPLCPYCGEAYIRPDVVWFNEMLPPDAIERAITVTRHADVMLIIGTSGVVWPAAGLPPEAKTHGAKLIEINPQASELTPITDYYLPGPSGEILPKVVHELRKLLSTL